MNENKNSSNVKHKENAKDSYTALGISLGMCFGVVIGIILDNIALYLPIGMCIGANIGLLIGSSKNKNRG